MKTIREYPLATRDRQIVRIPEGGEILSLQVRGETPCIWVLVDPDEPTCEREFRIFRTGDAIELGARRYVGSYQLFVVRDLIPREDLRGSLVFHVFEEGKAA